MTIYKSFIKLKGGLFSSKRIHKLPHSAFILFYFSTLIPESKSGGFHEPLKNRRHTFCRIETFLHLIKKFSSSPFLYQMTEIDNRFPNLQKVGLLNDNNILIKDKANVEKLISSLLRGSFDHLQLVVDFDYTLTRGHFRNEKALCSWGILDNSPHMPSFYRERSSQLLSKYYPIEIDPNKTEKEKIPSMIEWYQNILELLKKCNLNKKTLREMVSQSNVKLRDDTDQLFKKLKDEDVPMLIFSAGMGDILEHVLWHFDVYSENVKVVSNFFKYDEEGVMVGFAGDLIHMFNKNENSIHSSDYFGLLERRSNVVLMGDSLGDVKMAVGVPPSSNVLKIGFYNHNAVDSHVTAYTDTYDIVLVGDQSMRIVNSILAQIKR